MVLRITDTERSGCLQVSSGFISKWTQALSKRGVEGLRLQPWIGYLGTKQRLAVLAWLEQKNYWDLQELQAYLEDSYKVYFVLTATSCFIKQELVGKKTQKRNPKKTSVGEKQEITAARSASSSYWIRIGGVVYRWVSFVVGDVTGYVWGVSGLKFQWWMSVNDKPWSFELPHTRVLVKAYTQGNSSPPLSFRVSARTLSTTTSCYLLGWCQRVNRSAELKTYLQAVNQDSTPDTWISPAPVLL